MNSPPSMSRWHGDADGVNDVLESIDEANRAGRRKARRLMASILVAVALSILLAAALW